MQAGPPRHASAHPTPSPFAAKLPPGIQARLDRERKAREQAAIAGGAAAAAAAAGVSASSGRSAVAAPSNGVQQQAQHQIQQQQYPTAYSSSSSSSSSFSSYRPQVASSQVHHAPPPPPVPVSAPLPPPKTAHAAQARQIIERSIAVNRALVLGPHSIAAAAATSTIAKPAAHVVPSSAMRVPLAASASASSMQNQNQNLNQQQQQQQPTPRSIGMMTSAQLAALNSAPAATNMWQQQQPQQQPRPQQQQQQQQTRAANTFVGSHSASAASAAASSTNATATPASSSGFMSRSSASFMNRPTNPPAAVVPVSSNSTTPNAAMLAASASSHPAGTLGGFPPKSQSNQFSWMNASQSSSITLNAVSTNNAPVPSQPVIGPHASQAALNLASTSTSAASQSTWSRPTPPTAAAHSNLVLGPRSMPPAANTSVAPSSSSVNVPANTVAPSSTLTATNIWARSTNQPPRPNIVPPQQQQQQAPQQQPAAAAASSSSSGPANATFISHFRQPPPPPPKVVGGVVGFPVPQRIPLCRAHNLPMNTAICGPKSQFEGQRFWACSLAYTSTTKERCSWFLDRDLFKHPELRYQQMGPNGETLSEVLFSCELVSDELFSITISPPDTTALEVMRAENGVVDEKAANTSNYHKANPPVWQFSLQRHDEIMQKIESTKQQLQRLWTIRAIPQSARTLLLQDMQNARLASYAAQHAQHKPESDAAHLIASQLAPSPVIAPSSSSDADETPKSQSRKGKKGSLLMTKAAAKKAEEEEKQEASQALVREMKAKADAARHLTPEEETQLNPEKLPPQIRIVLLPFQFEGVEYLVSHGGRGLLADEMGLGKSLQSLAVASYYHDDWPLLIICPSSLRLNWEMEISKWLPFLSTDNIFTILTGADGRAVLTADPNHKRVQGRTFGIVIVSYDLVPKLIDEIRAYKFGCIVCDESHWLKNHKAQRTKVIVPLLKETRRAILLSGTPAMNRPMELYTQISAIKPKLFPKREDFGLRYCDGKRMKIGAMEHMDYNGASHLRELHVLLKKYLLIRREKAAVLKQLPLKRRQTITLEIPGKNMRELKALQEKHDIEEDDLMRGGQDPHLTRMFQLTGEAKVSSVCEYIDELMEAGIKFLLFGHHKIVLDRLEEHITAHKTKTKFIRIDGHTPPVKRAEYVKQFQESDECKIALLSITAAGTGLTLSSASHVVFAELLWTPAVLVQAEDRVHRIGQHMACNMHYLLARGTLDDIMWPMIERKLAVIGTAISGEEMQMTIDESKQYTSIDANQKRLTGFFSEDKQREYEQQKEINARAAIELQEASERQLAEDDDAAMIAALDSFEQEQKAEEKAEEENEDFLFVKPVPGSRSHHASPAKRQKTTSNPSTPSSASKARPPAVSSAAAASLSTVASIDRDDDMETYDLTLAPDTSRVNNATVGGSASSVNSARVSNSSSPNIGRSPNTIAAPTNPFARRKPMMLVNSPNIGNATTAATASPPVVRTSPKPVSSSSNSPTISTHSASSSSPSSSVSPMRRRKRIREEDENGDDSDEKEESKQTSKVDASSGSSSPVHVDHDVRMHDENDMVVVEHNSPVSEPKVPQAVSARKKKASGNLLSVPLPKPPLATPTKAKTQLKTTPTKAPQPVAAAPEAASAPPDDDDDFLD